MKKLLSIALIFLISCAAAPVPITPLPPCVHAEASSVYSNLSVDTLYATAGDPNCPTYSVATYSWSKVSGPGTQTIIDGTTKQATVTGLQTGWYVFKTTVTSSSGLTNFDTVQFIVNIPIVKTVTIASPPITVTVTKLVHDTLWKVDPIDHATWDGKSWHYYFKSGLIQ